jgi:adenosine deaminase
VAAGIPVALCTDDPVQMCTTIGREYALAHALGFAIDDLLGLTRNAIRVAFIAPPQRTALLAEVDTWDNNAHHK